MPDSLSFTGARWDLLDVDARSVAALVEAGFGEVTARCAILRWEDAVVARRLLASASMDDLIDPYQMLGMDAAVQRLRHAIDTGQRVRIITDYDVDGTTSSLILQATLRLVGPDVSVDYHIPNRLTEGYGLSVDAVDAAAEAGVDLVIAADIGVRDNGAVERARERGVDVLICDHHLPDGAEVPEGALVLCPPQPGCTYPNKSLAACGIALKVAQAMLRDHPASETIVRSLLKLAAMGTVADMVPLTTPENRAIVSLGLAELNEGRHAVGLQALLDVCGLRPGEIGEWDLGFRIGPRINAAGRVAEAALVVNLLMELDAGRARRLAGELDRHNHERRRIQEGVETEAMKQLSGRVAPFAVVAGSESEGWHRGVIGIVASRLRELLNRPTAVVAVSGDIAVGSVRSIPEVHAVQALDAASDLLVKYGGHPAAAGFTVRIEHLEELRERLAAHVVSLVGDEVPVPVRHADAIVDVEALDEALFEQLAALGPFGSGNPKPRLLIPRVYPRNVRKLGAEKRMVKLDVPRRGARALEAIWWNRPEHADALGQQPVDLLATLETNTWRGVTRLQLRLRDARPSR